VPALCQSLGSSTGLSAAVITRLAETWKAEQRAFAERDLSQGDWAHNPEVASSNPAPLPTKCRSGPDRRRRRSGPLIVCPRFVRKNKPRMRHVAPEFGTKRHQICG
jgi:hypothetical protein